MSNKLLIFVLKLFIMKNISNYSQIEEIVNHTMNELQNQFYHLHGTCYLIGHCLNMIFNDLGYTSQKVTGHLHLKRHNIEKYLSYGTKINKSISIGYFHTWCEVLIGDQSILIDPSLRFNKPFLKLMGYKVSKLLPGTLITTSKNGYHWIYKKDTDLEKLSKTELKRISESQINKIVSTVVRQFRIT
jgi:hypothetical protein